MGFGPRQCPSRLEMVNKITEWMKAAVKEAKAAIWKAQEDMTWYYNQRRSLALVFCSGDWVLLDITDIKTIHPSPKLLHHHLRPFIVE